MGVIVLNPPKLTHEEMSLAIVRRDYLDGIIDVDEFEHQVEEVLNGRLAPRFGMAISGELR